jgi:PAS domain S-box-containing protein
MADFAEHNHNRRLSEEIAQRRQAELALRESAERLRQAVRVSGIGIFDHDQVAGTIYWSPEQREIYGVGPDEEITLQLFLGHVHPEDLDRIGPAVARAHDPSGDGLFDVEHRIVRDDGSVRWITTRSQTYFEGEGAARRPVRTIGAIVDVTERRHAEEMQSLLAAVVETSNDAIITRRPGGEIVSWNAGAERMFGWKAIEAVGRDINLISPPEFRHEARRNTTVLGDGASIPPFETVRVTKDGRRIDVQISASGVYQSDGRLRLVAGIFRDVTARKALEVERGRLAAIVDGSADAIIGRAMDGTVLTWNRAAERMFGYSAAQIVGRSIDLLVPADRRDEVARRRVELALGGGGASYDTVRLGKDGRPIDVSATQSPIRDATGEVVGVSLTFRDISERKRAEAALAESERRFRALVDLSSDWYWQTDEQHRFIFREGEVLRRMGIPPEADYGKRRWEMDFTNMSDADWAAHRALLERREEFRGLLLQRRSPDGRLHWATISGRPLFDVAGTYIGYHGTGRDVTDQVNAELALRQLNAELEGRVGERTAALQAANSELEAFSYSVSHDLRAPLRAIDGFSHLLASQLGDRLDPEARRLLGRIRAGAQRMGQLITDLLELSRVTRTEVRREAVDLSALAESIAGELKADAAAREVQWRIETGLRARCDPALVRIALFNLLGNALKYTRDVSPARIEFGVSRGTRGEAEFFVRDNGAGFDMAFADRLFQPFQRLHAAQEFEGTGIGLATAQRVVAKHGGTLRGEGRPGAGATFYFSLPG